MITIEVNAASEAEDIQAGRDALDLELGRPEKVIMVIRGDTDMDGFAAMASGRAATSWREVIWCKVDNDLLQGILSNAEYQGWFAGNPGSCSVVLDGERQVRERLEVSATDFEIEMAFLEAES
jgi:hypothetical protein